MDSFAGVGDVKFSSDTSAHAIVAVIPMIIAIHVHHRNNGILDFFNIFIIITQGNPLTCQGRNCASPV